MTEEQMKQPTMPPVDLPEPTGEEDEQINIMDLEQEPEEGSDGDDSLATELDQIRAERDEYEDRYKRAIAEVENNRKRSERERLEAELRGGSRLARDILPIHDSLARALAVASEEQRKDSSGLLEGVELTMRELLNVFRKHGIVQIAPKPGDRFDPLLHEAMFEAPIPNTNAGDIIEVAEVGFTQHDRLLRPAKVGVSSMVTKPTAPEAGSDADDGKLSDAKTDSDAENGAKAEQ